MLNPSEVSRIVDEIASDKVTLICGKHNYVAARRRANGVVAVPPEPRGCAECQQVYFVTDYALTPPGKRQERLDELEEVIHRTVEYEEKGQFGADFELYEPNDPRFGVQFHEDAADDDTGEDKKVILTDLEEVN